MNCNNLLLNNIDNNFLNKQLLTYLGNKRELKDWFINYLQQQINMKPSYSYSFLDGFSGSGIISRCAKIIPNISDIYCNDWEYYSYIYNSCYLSNVPIHSNKFKNISYYIDKCNQNKLVSQNCNNYIYGNYTPLDDNNIQLYDRCFYTSKNGIIIDNIRNYINKYIPEEYQKYCIGSLLYECSVKNNTCGYFNSFYKSEKQCEDIFNNNKIQIGKYGGKNSNDLKRITADIELPIPVFSSINKNITISCQDMNKYVETMTPVDITYYDPPYNKHPYGTFYFMLNEIAEYNTNKILPKHNESIRGQSNDWKRSDYNSFSKAEIAFEKLIENTKSNKIIVSYYNKGIISIDNMKNILEKYGSVEIINFDHKPYHKLIGQGSKFISKIETKKNNSKLNEYLFILNKK
jgi:adenine-specific DNA-methyltransferase